MGRASGVDRHGLRAFVENHEVFMDCLRAPQPPSTGSLVPGRQGRNKEERVAGKVHTLWAVNFVCRDDQHGRDGRETGGGGVTDTGVFEKVGSG